MPVGGQASETPEAAVLDWLDAHGDVFLGTGEVAKPEFLVVDSSPLSGDRVVVRFEQLIEGPRQAESFLTVYGTHGRGIAYESVGGWVVSYVSCAALDVPLHEGFADVIATRYYDTDIVAYAGFGCDNATTPGHIRDWAAIDTAWTTANNCADSQYLRGQQLVLVWRDLEGRMDDTSAR